MIGWLKGKVVERDVPGRLVLDVRGVGYEVETSLSTFFHVEFVSDEVTLFIHTIVREDAFLLYGFRDKHERALFKTLIKVNGVGPKLAIAILSSMTPDEFIHAIHEQNTARLVTLPGVGKKTAERLVVEMKDRLEPVATAISVNLPATVHHEAVSALEALGYKYQEASKAVKAVDAGQQSCESLIRLALQQLSKR